MALSSSAASARLGPSRGSLEDGARMPITPTGMHSGPRPEAAPGGHGRAAPAGGAGPPTELHRDSHAHGFAQASAQA
jgi:hypothetical protein